MVYNTGLKLNKEETLKSGNISCEENGEYCVYEIPDDVNSGTSLPINAYYSRDSYTVSFDYD
jgi:hypothetical protein